MFQRKQERGSTVLGAIVGGGLAVLVLLVALLTRQALQDVESLKSAMSDNVQWTLSQTEVDHVHFVDALEDALAVQGRELTATEVEEIRKAFDIFFSRSGMLKDGKLFFSLNSQPEFTEPLRKIRSVLIAYLPVIDGPDDRLIAALPGLMAEIDGLRPQVREISVQGLALLARQSDNRREALVTTITRAMALVAGLLVALVTVSAYLLFVNRKTFKRGIQIQQVSERIKTVLATSQDAVVVLDISWRVTEFNAVAERMFGFRAADVIGRPVSENVIPLNMRDLLHQRDRQRAAREQVVTAGPRLEQFTARRKDGTVFPAELTLQSAFDGTEEIIVGFIRDISRQVGDEKELVEARDRALTGEKVKAEFLTVMSHEIRTPLNGILGNLSLLEETELSEEQAAYVRSMEISGKLLMGHINSVLDIASLEAGKMTVVLSTVDTDEVLQECVESQFASAAARGNSLEWYWVGKRAPWVITDRRHLQQILLNLLGNAIKFTENGHIAIEVEQSPLPSNGGRKQPGLEFRVVDTGMGIPEEQFDLIFDDFRTTDASFRRSAGGTGLGLGIARRLARNLGGEIGVESMLGEGSVFHFHIPVQIATAPDAHRHVDSGFLESATFDILVVEDNEINLQVVSTMLRKQGHRVAAAVNGQAAVEQAAGRRFDLILMDISMPVMDGLEATRLIRRGTGASRDSVIVAFSANVLPGDRQNFLAEGMNGFLGKPLVLKDLRRLLLEHVPKARAKRANGAVDVAEPDGSELVRTRISEMREVLGDDGTGQLLQRLTCEFDDLLAGIDADLRAGCGWPALADSIHKAAGSAGAFGLVEIQTLLAEMEDAAKASDAAAIHVGKARLEGAWSESRPLLRL
ncbi:ATP-binding protein [Ruegeria sp. WL0004]|uniref:histidine kinase n=1 Tax=Ruegeria marisflavi TaxID=2984152 RepID=A0ABT2WZS1_9RHOB|nr:ATP-binding protein [Ruegeria sp. WL0004]MCU9839428.1 ATP-binding protein [Ruegeria sp. WL0004]